MSRLYVALATLARLILSLHLVLGRDDWHQAGDVPFYFRLAGLTDQGFYPFIHFWTEYPPLFPFLISGVYRLLALAGLTSPEAFTFTFAGLFFCVEVANMVLLHRLINRAYGEKSARLAVAIYAGCPALVWVCGGWFDPLAVLFTLAALHALTCKKSATAGVLIALGVLTKIFPGVLILVAPAALGWRGTRRLIIAMLGTLAALLTPLLVIRPELFVASLASMTTRGPWETLPAVLSGYYGWGMQPQIEERFTAASAFASSNVPTWLTLFPESALLLAAAGAWLTLKRRHLEPHHLYAVAALGVTTFLLGSKGFSPQFVAWLVPMVLLVWPNRTGLVYVALISAHTLAYVQIVFPPMYAYYSGQQGELELVVPLVTVSVVARTLLIAWIVGHLFAVLARRPNASTSEFVEMPLRPFGAAALVLRSCRLQSLVRPSEGLVVYAHGSDCLTMSGSARRLVGRRPWFSPAVSHSWRSSSAAGVIAEVRGWALTMVAIAALLPRSHPWYVLTGMALLAAVHPTSRRATFIVYAAAGAWFFWRVGRI